MAVQMQHNGHACGLYLLKYVERLAWHQVDLGRETGLQQVQLERMHRVRCGPQARPPTCEQHSVIRWSDFPCLAFTPKDIDAARTTMAKAIEDAGRAQKRQRVA